MTKNPDSDILQTMWRLAQLLRAQVQGDDGELHGSNGECTPLERMKISSPRRWWKFW